MVVRSGDDESVSERLRGKGACNRVWMVRMMSGDDEEEVDMVG